MIQKRSAETEVAALLKLLSELQQARKGIDRARRDFERAASRFRSKYRQIRDAHQRSYLELEAMSTPVDAPGANASEIERANDRRIDLYEELGVLEKTPDTFNWDDSSDFFKKTHRDVKRCLREFLRLRTRPPCAPCKHEWLRFDYEEDEEPEFRCERCGVWRISEPGEYKVATPEQH